MYSKIDVLPPPTDSHIYTRANHRETSNVWLLEEVGGMEFAGLNLKILKYEEFLNETLKSDLKAALDAREAIFSEVAEYLQLKNVVEKMAESTLPHNNLKTMVDIGSNFYMKAVVPDASYVIVSVGLNVYVEFTHKEALEFVEKKIEHLNGKAETFTRQAADIKARIKLVMEGLKELQFSKHYDETETQQRVVW